MAFAPLPPLGDLLAAHADALGGDFEGYRHARRVARLCAAPPARRLHEIAVAAALHDLGIWTDGARRRGQGRYVPKLHRLPSGSRAVYSRAP